MAVTQSDLESAKDEFDKLKAASARERDIWAEQCASNIKPWVEMQLSYHARYDHAVVDKLTDAEIIELKRQAAELAKNAAEVFPTALANKGLTHGNVSNLRYAESSIRTAAQGILKAVPLDLAKLLERTGFTKEHWKRTWEFFEGYGDARSDRASVPLPDAGAYARAYLAASEAQQRIELLTTALAQQKSQSRFDDL